MNIEDKKIAILSITQNGKSLGLNIKNNIKNADLYFIKRDIVENETNVIHINKRLKDYNMSFSYGGYDIECNKDGKYLMKKK